MTDQDQHALSERIGALAFENGGDVLGGSLSNHEDAWRKLKAWLDVELARVYPVHEERVALVRVRAEMSDIADALQRQQDAWREECPMTLSRFLRKEINRGHIDFAVRARINEDNDVAFYIHTQGYDSDTLDFVLSDEFLFEILQARFHAKGDNHDWHRTS